MCLTVARNERSFMHYQSTCVVTMYTDTRYTAVRHVLFHTLRYIRQKAKRGSKRHSCDKHKFCVNKLQPKRFIKYNLGHANSEFSGLPKNCYFLTLLPESVIHCHIPSHVSDMSKQISVSVSRQLSVLDNRDYVSN